MIAAGIDIGSTTTKVVILDETDIRVSLLSPSGDLPGKTVVDLFSRALENTGLTKSQVQVIASTGYGRRLADFSDIIITEIKACAKGILHQNMANGCIRTIIDVGGQDTKVIALNNQGSVEDFGMNDKCAAGTGRFLEVLAQKLNLSYDEFVEKALHAETTLQMNSTCAVFAESEVVGLLAKGIPSEDIASAAHNAIASRIASMVKRVSQSGEYCFVGGGARNAALVKSVESEMGHSIIVPSNSQMIVALGAAMCGVEAYHKTTEKRQ